MPKDWDVSMKFYADLHLCPSLERTDEARELIRKSAELGYDAVGVAFPLRVEQSRIQAVREMCRTCGLDLVTRVDLTPNNPVNLLKSLRNLRRQFEVVAVLCLSKAVARQAAKDRRVDVISFPSTDSRKRFFDSAEAALASEAMVSFGVDMSPLLQLQGFQRSRLLSFLRKETLIARKSHVPIVISSGASSASLLRKPEDYAFLSYLFGLDFGGAMRGLCENPRTIVERNRRKLSPNYVAPGVYIVRRGEDCHDG